MSARPKPALQDGLPLIRVLVAEDDRMDRQMIWRRLRSVDRQIAITFTGTLDETRRQLAETRFRGLILDNSLPDGNGVDFARELARKGARTTPPIVILSGWPSPFMAEKAEEAAVRGLWSKETFDARAARALLTRLGL
ncbi:MAG: response regulator [Pseudomonadota bacterium]